VFVLIEMWCVLDRFYVNLFPMQLNFPPLTDTLVPARIDGGIPPAVALFDGFGRAVGRFVMVVFNALFLTQCKTTENVLMEHHPRWLHLGDLRTHHNQIHYILGFLFMGVPLVSHMLLIFFPPMAGVPLNVQAGRAALSVTPFIYTNNRAVNMLLNFDDVFRLVQSLLLFCVVFPFSISNWARNKHFALAHWMHICGAALFSVDMVRRSPHAQIFCTPVIAYYLADRVIGIFFYRTGLASLIHKEQLDSDYVVVFLYVPKQKRRRMVGSTYYVNFNSWAGMLDMAHPYIAFQNHTGEALLPEWRNRDSMSTTHKFYIERSAGERKAFNRRDSLRVTEDQLKAQEEELERASSGIAQETDETVFFSNWNTALVVQIHHSTARRTFTHRLERLPLASRLRFWGPFLSEYALVTPDGKSELPPLILIGTGAGCGPILDFYMHMSANNFELPNPVTVYFSTNSVGLFQFFTDLVCAKSINNWRVNAHLTQAEDYEQDFEKDEVNRQSQSERGMKLGRLSFMEVLRDAPKSSHVYFCGAPALQWKVGVACSTYSLKYFPGHRFAAGGASNSCHRVGTFKFVCLCSKFPLCCMY
jgi:hypothetical protein